MNNFWNNLDFWIFLLLSIISILVGWLSVKFSIKSFKEAQHAKHAAQKAGKTVRKQDIIVILTEVLNECNIQQNTQYYNESLKYRIIHRRISHIRGLYSNDLNDEQQGYLEKIESSLEVVRSQLDLFNTSISGDIDETTEDFLFMSLEPPMTEVAGSIELLKGSLQDSLI